MQNIFSTKSFYEWVNSKDPNEIYDYWDVDNCACAQYYKDKGIVKEYERYDPSYHDKGGFEYYAAVGPSLRSFGELARAISRRFPELVK